MPLNNVETMYAMLRYRRPHRSKTERKFIQRFITSLGGMDYDRFGNRYRRIGNAPILYSCHTDTVHRHSGLQDLAINGAKFKLPKKSDSNCLGADNTAGVWMMHQMIEANKPGLYVFHRGEECGRLGSLFIAKQTPELVKDIKYAIAFDRRNTKSIITHQIGGRCCSDAFAESLAKELKLGHQNDPGGTYTDTASYTDLVPECTNVSVGFQNEHSDRETLDMAYLLELRQAMIEMNWENLVEKRKAGEYEPRYQNSYSWYGKKRWRQNEDQSWDYWDDTSKMWIAEEKEEKTKLKSNFVWDSKLRAYVRKDDVASTQRWKGNAKKHWDHYTAKSNKQKGKSEPVGFLPDLRPKNVQGDLLADGHELDEMDRPGRKPAVKLRPVDGTAEDNAYMIRMIRNNPALIQKFLEDYGVSVDDLADFIHTNNGMVPWELLGDTRYGAVYSDD